MVDRYKKKKNEKERKRRKLNSMGKQAEKLLSVRILIIQMK